MAPPGHAATLRIDDPSDPRVALFRVLRDPELLRRHGAFIAESRAVVRRLLQGSRFEVTALFVTPRVLEELGDLVAGADFPIYVADLPVMREVTGYRVHRGCVAAGARRPGWGLDDILRAAPPLLVGLEAVSDPDNVGGIFRSAVAFGAGGVLLDSRSADPLYRKAIRTSMGSTLRLPFVTVDPWPRGLDALRERGYQIAAVTPDADARDITALDAATRARPTVLVLGNEGSGLQSELRRHAELRLRIPMTEVIDSLNVATAAAIALHHFAKVPPPG